MNLIRTFLAIAIAVVFTVFIAYGVYVVYEPPKIYSYSSPCYLNYSCEEMTSSCYNKNSTNPEPYPNKCAVEIEQSAEYTTCMENRDACDKMQLKDSGIYAHSRNSFFILLAIGLAAILGGSFLIDVEGVSSGFIAGGVMVILWSLIYTAQYWLTLSKYLKLIALGALLALLIYLGYKRISKRK